MDVRPFRREDAQAALDLRVQAFTAAMHVDLADVEPEDGVPDEHRLVADHDGRVVGHLAVWPFAQAVGGRVVPMGGVAGVAVASDRRGRGTGSALLAAGLDHLADHGFVVSTLYPSLPLPYRRWGWEVAGDLVRRSMLVRDLLVLPDPPADVDLRPFDMDDLAAVRAIHNEVTRHEPGGLVAPEVWLARAFRPDPDEPEIATVAVRDGEVVGASLATKSATEAPGMAFDLDVPRLFGRDRGVELALWRQLALHHSVAERVTFASRPAEPLLFELPHALPPPHPSSHVWMTRLVDAPAAVAARGWPAVDAEVALTVHDERRPANDGAFVLESHGGEAALSAGGAGTVHVDVGALSAMWTGYATPHALAHAGRLRGADASRLDVLSTLFAAPSPFLRDYF